MSKKKEGLTIVVGCGELGATVATHIYDHNGNVIVIDRHKDSFSLLASSFGGMTIMGDGCDFEILRRADIEHADTVIAVTDFDNNNIFIGQTAKAIFNVKNVIVRVKDKNVEAIYKDMGIKTICPAELATNAVINSCLEDN